MRQIPLEATSISWLTQNAQDNPPMSVRAVWGSSRRFATASTFRAGLSARVFAPDLRSLCATSVGRRGLLAPRSLSAGAKVLLPGWRLVAYHNERRLNIAAGMGKDSGWPQPDAWSWQALRQALLRAVRWEQICSLELVRCEQHMEKQATKHSKKHSQKEN
jgi:hypothetical protein